MPEDNKLAIQKQSPFPDKASSILYRPELLDQAERLARSLSRARLVPRDMRGNPGDILLTILAGKELGLSPIQAFRGLCVVEGKVEMHARLIHALAKQHPQCKDFRHIETDDNRAIWEIEKTDGTVKRHEFTYEKAQRAGLVKTKGAWEKWRQEMLNARCISQLAGLVFPEIFFGIDVLGAYRENTYIDPLDAVVEEHVIDALPLEEEPFETISQERQDDLKAVHDDYLEKIRNAETKSQLIEVGEAIAKIEPAVGEALRSHYVEKLDALRAVEEFQSAVEAMETANVPGETTDR